jgi:hypothetical protein
MKPGPSLTRRDVLRAVGLCAVFVSALSAMRCVLERRPWRTTPARPEPVSAPEPVRWVARRLADYDHRPGWRGHR